MGTLPVAVMGPILGSDVSGSNHLIQMMLSGGMPRFPDIYLPVVDVRDVATGHIAAMTTPAAAGERFLLAGGPVISMKEIGAKLRTHLGTAADRVPTRSIPNIVVRAAALFSPQFRSTVPDLGYRKQLSDAKARRILGWEPREAEQAIVAAAETMISKWLATAG